LYSSVVLFCSLCPCMPRSPFFELVRPSPPPPLFPYTTLFRSHLVDEHAQAAHVVDLGELERLGAHLRIDAVEVLRPAGDARQVADRKSTRLNSSHGSISYAVFCLKKKTNNKNSEAHTG